jgi:mono/diheme cytochrome c family protein
MQREAGTAVAAILLGALLGLGCTSGGSAGSEGSPPPAETACVEPESFGAVDLEVGHGAVAETDWVVRVTGRAPGLELAMMFRDGQTRFALNGLTFAETMNEGTMRLYVALVGDEYLVAGVVPDAAATVVVRSVGGGSIEATPSNRSPLPVSWYSASGPGTPTSVTVRDDHGRVLFRALGIERFVERPAPAGVAPSLVKEVIHQGLRPGLVPLGGDEVCGPDLSPDALALGQRLYTENCSACHGSGGIGSVGPSLAGGASAETFPDPADERRWIELGSQEWPEETYGTQDKPVTGGQPAFGEVLSSEEIDAVIAYEPEVFR